MLKKILVADSGNGKAQEMVKVLLDIPPLRESSITILHVVPEQITPGSLTEKWEEGGKLLAQALESLKLDPTKVSTILRQGDPKTVVCQVAEEIDTDLIVMGSRGLKRLQSILQNSVSQYVFQLSSRPMLLVKDDIFVKRINRVMVAYDRSAAAQQCLDTALNLARNIKGVQLILAHIGKDSVEPAATDPVLAPAIARAKTLGIETRCYSTAGTPGEAICQIAEQSNADLLILGSPERRPSIAKSLPDLDRLLGSSISDYVRVQAPCPVLLLRTQEG